jgi:hypothetical protein
MNIIQAMPAATITNPASGSDPVVGPGFPACIEGVMPVTCLGDAVAGPTCVGAIIMTPAVTQIYGGRPRGTTAAMAAGSNPAALFTPITVPVIGIGV